MNDNTLHHFMLLHHYTEDKNFFDVTCYPEVMELNRETDAHSPSINIPGGLIFGRKLVTTAFVSAIHPSTMS